MSVHWERCANFHDKPKQSLLYRLKTKTEFFFALKKGTLTQKRSFKIFECFIIYFECCIVDSHKK